MTLVEQSSITELLHLAQENTNIRFEHVDRQFATISENFNQKIEYAIQSFNSKQDAIIKVLADQTLIIKDLKVHDEVLTVKYESLEKRTGILKFVEGKETTVVTVVLATFVIALSYGSELIKKIVAII